MAEPARRSLAGALDVYKEEVMALKRTVFGRSRRLNHNGDARGHARDRTHQRASFDIMVDRTMISRPV